MTPPAASATDESFDFSVENFAVCEVQHGMRLIGAPVAAITIYLVLAGEMHMTLPSAPAIVAGAGSLVLLPSGHQPSIAPAAGPAIDIHATRNYLLRNEGLLVFDAAHGGPGDLRVMVGRIGGGGARAAGLLGTSPLVDDLRELPAARSAFATILGELKKPRLGSATLAAALMTVCVVLFSRRIVARLEQAAAPAPLQHARLAAAAAAILDHPEREHSVASLASLAGMSRSTFARVFAESMGTSPMDFVQKARLNRGASLLRRTGLSVKEIAAAAGFASRSHFSRSFRAAFGSDPRRYRAQPPDDPDSAFQ